MLNCLADVVEEVKYRQADAVKLLNKLASSTVFESSVEQRSFLLASSSVFLKCWEQLSYGLLEAPDCVISSSRTIIARVLDLEVSSNGIWLGGTTHLVDGFTSTGERQLLSVVLLVGCAIVQEEGLIQSTLHTLEGLFKTTSEFVSILFSNDDKMITTSLAILTNELIFRDTIFSVERVVAYIFIQTSFSTQTVILWLRGQLSTISLMKRFITRITASGADFLKWKKSLTFIDSEIEYEQERGFWVEAERSSPEFVLRLTESKDDTDVQNYPLFAKDAVYGYVDGFPLAREENVYSRFVMMFKELREILIMERPKGIDDPLVKILSTFEAKCSTFP